MSQRSAAEISAIEGHLASLKQEPWLGSPRRWWPDYLFHCTDIRNAVRILDSGQLLSRTQAQATGQLQVDIAAPDIIDQTSAEWRDHVRLYFRPRTPTQFNNEGFRPMGQWSQGAHCPVPVYLLLDAKSVLSRAECLFTDGNVAADAVPMESMDQLRQVPFRLVYHDTWFDPPERATIVYHRNAEVLIPQRLDLQTVRWVFCRSPAEYETLLHLLPPGTRGRWVKRIGVQPRLFYNRWTFVQQTEMSSRQFILRFNSASSTPGPFAACVEVVELTDAGPIAHRWHDDRFQTKPNRPFGFKLPSRRRPRDYVVRFFLDEQLAFAGRYRSDTLPF